MNIGASRTHTKAYVCIHVFDKSKPIRLVSRPNGDWCFLCGDVHDDDPSLFRVVGFEHLLSGDPTLQEISDLPANHEAERDEIGSPWIRTNIGKGD